MTLRQRIAVSRCSCSAVARLAAAAIVVSLVGACTDSTESAPTTSTTSRSSSTPATTERSGGSPLDGLPSPLCDGSTYEMEQCIAPVRHAYAARLQQQIDWELARLDERIADPRADDGSLVLVEESRAALERAAAGWETLVDDLCSGIRGFEGSWSGIDIATCEIEVIESILWQVWEHQHRVDDDWTDDDAPSTRSDGSDGSDPG